MICRSKNSFVKILGFRDTLGTWTRSPSTDPRPSAPSATATAAGCIAWSRHPVSPSPAMRRHGRRTAAQHRGVPPRPARRGGAADVERRRLVGRSGPGAGRPTKLYRATTTEVMASIPERHYELAGELLAAAIERAERDGIPVERARLKRMPSAGASARARRRSRTRSAAAATPPPKTGGAGLTLENCPFHALATRHTPLVCGANLARSRASSRASRGRPDAVTRTLTRALLRRHPSRDRRRLKGCIDPADIPPPHGDLAIMRA